MKNFNDNFFSFGVYLKKDTYFAFCQDFFSAFAFPFNGMKICEYVGTIYFMYYAQTQSRQLEKA